jgi:arsenate reductase
MTSGTRVLFVCVQNAGRSQIAAILFDRRGGAARSAGTRPANRMHENVAAALAERGFDLTATRPKRLTVEDIAWADLVVTMGCGDQCPATEKPTEDWPLPDPKDMTPAELDALIDEIDVRVGELVARGSRRRVARTR